MAAKPEEQTKPEEAAIAPPEQTPPVDLSQLKPEDKITVTAKAKIMHDSTIFAEGADITDTFENLKGLLDTGNAEFKAKAK
jgi:hypothetical protein